MRERVIDLISIAYESAIQEAGVVSSAPVDQDTRLYGEGAALDSMGLVSLVLGVEERVSDELGTDVTLMDERALSQERSPFRTVGSLADYVVQQLSA